MTNIWLGPLNFIVLQWFFVRLAKLRDADTKESLGYNWLVGVIPLTGWISDYKWVSRKSNPESRTWQEIAKEAINESQKWQELTNRAITVGNDLLKQRDEIFKKMSALQVDTLTPEEARVIMMGSHTIEELPAEHSGWAKLRRIEARGKSPVREI